MKSSPVLALLAVCVPIAAPTIARAQTNVPMLQPLPMAPPSAATSDAFLWRFAPPVGSRWTMRSFARSTSNTQLPAQNGQPAQRMKVNSIVKLTADYDVLSRDELGATTIRLTLRDMTTDTASTFDGRTVKSPTLSTAKPVNGATLTIKQASDGTVWGVAGMRAFQRRLLESSGVLDKATITQVLDATPMTSNTAMIKSMSQMGGTLPTSPVRLGESWNYDVTLPEELPFALGIKGTRTLKQLDDDIAVVADSAVLAGGDSSRPMPNMPGMGGLKIDYGQLRGTVSGVSRVQRSSGLPLETTINQTMRGNISSQTPAAQKMIVPIDVTTATRVVLEPR